MKTRKDAREQVQAAGLGDVAAEFLSRVDAPARLHARVGMTMSASRAAAESVGAGNLDSAAALVVLLDLVGVGGRLGCEGVGTTRLPCFRSLGKGRKQASDGEAWMAAAVQAYGGLRPDGYDIRPLTLVRMLGSGFGIGWAATGYPDPPTFGNIITVDQAYRLGALEQFRALVRLALWRHAHSRLWVVSQQPAMRSWGCGFDVLTDVGHGSESDWAALLEYVETELSESASPTASPVSASEGVQ